MKWNKRHWIAVGPDGKTLRTNCISERSAWRACAGYFRGFSGAAGGDEAIKAAEAAGYTVKHVRYEEVEE